MAQLFNEDDMSRSWEINVAESFYMTLDRDTSRGCLAQIDAFNKTRKKMDEKSFELLEAFIHFTYKVSSGNQMIVDTRTYKLKEKSLLLTDPVIFSTNCEIYGSADLGKLAIDKMMSKHKCNSICLSLNLSEEKKKRSKKTKIKFCGC